MAAGGIKAALAKAIERLNTNVDRAKSVPESEFLAKPGFHLGGEFTS